MTTPDAHLADLSVAELARRTSEKEVSAVEVVEACLARIAERDPALNAFSVVLADEARAEAAARDRALAEGETPGPLHGVPVAIKEEIDVAGCVTTFGGRANSTPAAADGEVVRRLRAAGAVIIGKTRMPEFGQWPFTESVDGGYTRNPWNAGAHARWVERRHRGRRGRGHGARRHRRRRRWLDPDPVGVLRAVRPQAAARPGDHRADGAPVVGTRHGRARWRGRCSTPRSSTTSIRGNTADATCSAPPSRRRASPRRPAPSPAGCASAGPRSRRSRACAPTRRTSQAVRETAQLLTDLGHDVRRGRPALPGRDAGVRAAVLRRRPHRERRGGALRPAREAHARDLPARQLGAARRRPVGAAGGGEGGREGQPGLRRRRRAAHPDHRAPSAQGRGAGQGRHRAGRADGPADDRLRRAVERHRQPGRVGAGGRRRRRAAAGRAAGRPAQRRDHAAQPVRAAGGALVRGRCRCWSGREPAADPEGAGTPPPASRRWPGSPGRRCPVRWPAGSCW